jgi:glycosyltransferase involved in cell wall biosynthesis
MKKPIVSIIVPAYNASKYIEKTVISVQGQLFQEWELIIVDDGSTDDQNMLIEQLIKVDDRIQLLQQPNQGVSAARNNGYRKSQGRYVAFLDADDLWLPNNLSEKLLKFEHGDYGLVHSNATVIDSKGRETGAKLEGKEGNLLEDLLSWNGPHIPGPSSILVRREVMDLVGLFDTSLSTSADFDFFIRVASKFIVGHVPIVTWQYRVHSGNMHGNIRAMENDVMLIFRKTSGLGLFKSERFKALCGAKMYHILAACWIGDGKNIPRGIFFYCKYLVFHLKGLLLTGAMCIIVVS